MLFDPVKLEKYNKEVERLRKQLMLLQGSFVEKIGVLNKLVVWHYEKKFLKLTKELNNGRKHS